MVQITIRGFIATFSAMAILVGGVPASGRATTESVVESPAHVAMLPNGLRIVVLEDHAAPVVQVAMWYRFGSRYETPGKTGLAHGLEHMMFRGTPSISGASLDDLGARLGAKFNANTSDEYTHYYFVVPANCMDLMLHVEADRMRNLKLVPDDWDVEKKAVLQEWDQDNSNPVFRFAEDVRAKVFPDTRAGKSALGERDDVVRSTVTDLKKYYDEYYVPNNATLVVTGDVSTAAVVASAREWFGPIASRPLPNVSRSAVASATGASLERTSEFPFEVLDLAYALPGDDPRSERALATTELGLDALQNERGPLRKALIDSGLTLEFLLVPDSSRQVSVGQALFLVSPGHTAAEVRKAWDEALASALGRGIDAEYIDAARRSAIAGFTYSRDSITGLGNSLGSDYVFPGDTDPSDFRRLVEHITPAEVDVAMRTYFARPNVVGDLRPETTDQSKAKAPRDLNATVADNFTGRVPAGPIVQPPWVTSFIATPPALGSRVRPTAFTLPNGLKIVVQENHANPTVIVDGNVRQSPTFDPPGKDGVGRMASDLLGYGSARYDFAAQRKLADDLAAQMSFGSTFSAHGFARDLGAFLDAFADDLRRPTFREDRFSLVRSQSLAEIARVPLDPQYESRRTMLTALYPAGDPALREPTTTSIASISLEDVRTYAATYYRPDLTSLVVVGDVDAEDVHRKVLAAFGDWSAGPNPPDTELPAIPIPVPIRRVVESPSTRDAAVALATIGPTRTSPDFYGFTLMNSLLGNGSFDSRLTNELRQKRGIVYNVTSSLQADRNRGVFLISFRTHPEECDAAVAIVKQQLLRLQTELVSVAELDRQRTKIVAGAAVAEESTYAVADDLRTIISNGLPLDYYATLASRYRNVTPQDVLRIARMDLHPENLIEVRTVPASTP